MTTFAEPLSLLVIEDNPGDFLLISDFLREKIEGCRIENANSFKSAVELLEGQQAQLFDAILLDLSLPDKTGKALVEAIMELRLNAPVIVLTGYTDVDFAISTLSLGIADYILKDELSPFLLYKSIMYSIERKRISDKLEQSEHRLRNFTKQLNEMVEAQKAAIAREIHDEFGQQLAGLKMSLSSLKKADSTHTDTKTQIDELIRDVNHGIHSLRKIANELRPALLDKLGLFATIEWMLTEFQKKTGILGRIQSPESQPLLDSSVSINIFRICQEALTNIAKHAEATLVCIKLDVDAEALNIIISDNGKGADLKVLQNPLSTGLVGMNERARAIGAVIYINSSLQSGTIIKLNLALNAG